MECLSFMTALPGFLFEAVRPPEPSTERDSGEIIEWKAVMEKIIEELKKEPELMKELKYANNEIPLMTCLLKNSTVKKMIGEYVTQCKQQIEMGSAGKKNSAKATSIRLQGNRSFAKKQYRAALKLYTGGLMFAKDEDEETPLLYANRSTAFFKLKQYENTLQDIERAFTFGYDKIKPTGKLLIWKGFSLLALGRDAEVKELLAANMPANEDEPAFAPWQKLKKEYENVNRQIIKRDITMSQFQDVSTVRAALTNNDVFRPHERFPWLNAKIDLLYDTEKGYHLVSKEEMKYGEIVALSKPFVCLDPKRDSFERCHYCMVPCFEVPKYFTDKAYLAPEAKLSPDSLRMATPLACPQCSNVLYCSEACRTAAWTAYHRFECSQMMVLNKIDSKSHLALRMLYMMGSLDVESPDQKMVRDWETIEDHLALMVNQKAYSFIHKSPTFQDTTGGVKTLQMILTVFFHIKLLKMGNLLPVPRKNYHANGYLHQATNACGFLFHHLSQINVNESVPFTETTTKRTFTSSPYLLVDGMTSLMKHSCEATVATSSILRESFGSTVKLLFATGGVSAGTVLTLAYDTAEPHLEGIYIRKLELISRYNFICTCTRCLREERDRLDCDRTTYYPIACSLCGELMVREEADGSYRRSSGDGCNFKYSSQEMKNAYERVEAMMNKQLIIDAPIGQPFRDLECKVAEMKRALEETVPLLYGRSLFLAQLYGQLAECYLRLTLTVPPDSELLPVNVPPEAKYVYSPYLPSTLEYTGKALDILADRNLGPCATNCLAANRLLENLLPKVKFALSYLTTVSHENERRLCELIVSLVAAKDRYETLLKMTAFDTMVASYLPHQKSEGVNTHTHLTTNWSHTVSFVD